jgi:hypothetical protein
MGNVVINITLFLYLLILILFVHGFVNFNNLVFLYFYNVFFLILYLFSLVIFVHNVFFGTANRS